MRRKNTVVDGILVGVLSFFIFWNLLSGLSFFFNGAFTKAFISSIGIFFNLIPFAVTVGCLFVDKTCLSAKNMQYAIMFAVSFLLIFAFLALFYGKIEVEIAICALNGAILIALNDRLKLRCFDVMIRGASFLFAVSALEYLLYVLAGIGIVTTSVYREIDSQTFDQLLFNFINSKELFPRFQSLCEEPGVVGTISGLLLFAVHGIPRYRRQYVVFLISGLLSFSLAFYALLFIRLFTAKTKAVYILLLIAAVTAFYLVFQDFIDLLIVDRISGDSLSSVDNRTSEALDMRIADAWRDGTLWFGQRDLSFMHGEDVGSGAKVFLWNYGITGILLLFVSYLYYYVGKIKSLKSSIWACVLFFVVLWISFYQRQWIYHMDYLIIVLSVPLLHSPLYGIKRRGVKTPATAHKNSKIIKRSHFRV